MKPADKKQDTQRTLVQEMLIVQLVFAAFVGAIAIGCVWWVVNWVVRDNLDDWAQRWIVEMESLGTGLYLDETDERFLELENYLVRFPEILYVRYYDSAGQILYVEQAANDVTAYPALTHEEFLLLSEDAETHNVDTRYEPLVRISQAVVVEAIVKIDLFNADSMEDIETKSSVVGYVELGLDYDRYDRELLGSIVWGSIFVLLAVLAMAMVGRVALKRAMQPLIDIQNPLEAMAKGNLDIQVPESHHKEIANIGNALKTAIDRIQERDRNLRRLANHDALTDLPNRNHLIDELKQRMEQLVIEKCSGALLFIDLDKFKHVNDSYGHATGDSVLIQVAARLRQFVRKDDLVARYSGDEFVIFIAGVNADRADEIARKLIQDLREYPLSHSAHAFSVGCSVGITVAPYPPIFTPEELISQADLACRQAKSNGRKRTSHFKADEGQLDSIKSDLDWQQKLERAIQQDDIVLEYQPIMNLATTNINSYEVLVRLNDNGKLHYPSAFIPAAVRFGIMQDVDRWVISHAFVELARVRKKHPGIVFNINITGDSFGDGTLPRFITETLEKNNLPASSIILEITEQVAIGSVSQAIPQIEELVSQGCQFAVDDFGTGYSSLSYLKKLPVQYIKIDGAFVQRLTEDKADQTIVKAVGDIARLLGKKTVAEYVEDAKTLSLVRELGIDYAQGFFIGKPSLTPWESVQTNSRVVQLPKRARNG